MFKSKRTSNILIYILINVLILFRSFGVEYTTAKPEDSSKETLNKALTSMDVSVLVHNNWKFEIKPSTPINLAICNEGTVSVILDNNCKQKVTRCPNCFRKVYLSTLNSILYDNPDYLEEILVLTTASCKNKNIKIYNSWNSKQIPNKYIKKNWKLFITPKTKIYFTICSKGTISLLLSNSNNYIPQYCPCCDKKVYVSLMHVYPVRLLPTDPISLIISSDQKPTISKYIDFETVEFPDKIFNLWCKNITKNDKRNSPPLVDDKDFLKTLINIAVNKKISRIYGNSRFAVSVARFWGKQKLEAIQKNMENKKIEAVKEHSQE